MARKRLTGTSNSSGLAVVSPEVEECKGSTVAYARKITEPHQVPRRPGGRSGLFDECFMCHGVMGCAFCSVYPICRVCLVATDRDYFVARGWLSNDSYSVAARGGRRAPGHDRYPQSWVNDYIDSHPDTALREDEEIYQEYKALHVRFSSKDRGMMKTRVSERELERCRNEQVAALQETGHRLGAAR